MRQIFIHGGVYKTASEYLALNYFQKLDSYEFVALTPSNKKVNEINKIFLEIIYDNLGKEEGKKQITNILKNYETQKIILQNTGFFGHRRNGHCDFKKRFDLMEYLFEKPNYIIILRNQQTAIHSQWHASIKKKVKLPFEKYTDGDINFVKKQNLLFSKEITNYKLFDYNEYLDPYIKLSMDFHESKRVIFLAYEQIKQDQENFFSKINNFLNVKNVNFKINSGFYNKSNPLEEVNLFCFLNFKKTHVFILNIIFIIYKIFKFFGYDVNMKPPYINYKYERTLNLFSMIYLKFINNYVLNTIYKNKYEIYKKKKQERIEEIRKYYKDKNNNLERKLNLNLEKYNYF